MSTALLFDAEDIGLDLDIEPAPPTPPTPKSVRRIVSGRAQLALLPAEPTPDHGKAEWRQRYRERTGKVSLSLFDLDHVADDDDAVMNADGVIDLHDESDGECLAQHVGCPFRSCRHHLDSAHIVTTLALQRVAESEDEVELSTREVAPSCVLAVTLAYTHGLAPRYVAELLETTEAEVQSIEVYAVKALAAAVEQDSETSEALWAAKDALDDLDDLRLHEPAEDYHVRPSRQRGSEKD